MERLNVRKDIIDLVPYKEPFTANQLVEIVQDHHKFTPAVWLGDLSKKVRDCLAELIEEGIISVSDQFHPDGVRYFSEFKYYGR